MARSLLLVMSELPRRFRTAELVFSNGLTALRRTHVNRALALRDQFLSFVRHRGPLGPKVFVGDHPRLVREFDQASLV
jgi:hypothetical protein